MEKPNIKKPNIKKPVIIIAAVVLSLIVLMAVIPLLFQSQAAGLVKKQINKQLNATVNFEGVSLNLFEHFPNITVNVNNLSVVNKEPFKGDTLLTLQQFEASVDLWSVIAGDKMKINTISLDRPSVFLYVKKDSTANYLIAKEKPEEEKKEASNFNIGISSYSISSANIAYIDETSGIKAFISNLNHTGKGDFSSDLFDLATRTVIDALTLEMNGIPYLNRVKLDFDMNLGADLPRKTFRMKENTLSLNDLKLTFGGMARMEPDSSYYIDMTFASKDNQFKSIISLIPQVYSKDFESARSSGSMSLKGMVKGVYNKDRVPAMDISLNVKDGSLQYSKLPSRLQNVNADMKVSNPGGSADATLIDLRKLHFDLGNDPFDMRLLLKTPKSSPYVETAAKGKLNLGTIKNAIALKDVRNLAGLIDADFQAKGNLAAIQAKRPENINASGRLDLSGFLFEGKQLKEAVKIPRARLVFAGQTFQLQDFLMNIGKNDLSAKGSLSNVLSYVLSDAPVAGNLSVTSNFFDLNPFMQDEEVKTQKTAGKEKPEAVRLPDNIDFKMNALFSKLIYDNLTLSNVKGLLTLKDGRLSMQNLSMGLLNGSLIASGYYENKAGVPDISFSLNISSLDIKSAYESFVTVRTFAPMAKYISGNFGAKMDLTSVLKNDMTPVWNSFNSKGVLDLKSAKITGYKPFNVISNTLKISELKDPALTNVAPRFAIKNGRFYIEPFKFNVASNELTVAGSNGLDKSMDYSIELALPAKAIRSEANQALGRLFKRDVSVIKSDKIPVKVLVKGNVDDPTVTTSAGSVAEQATESVKQEVRSAITQEVGKKKEEVQKQAQKQADSLKKKLEEEAKKKIKGFFPR